jgi:hypothetical protein
MVRRYNWRPFGTNGSDHAAVTFGRLRAAASVSLFDQYDGNRSLDLSSSYQLAGADVKAMTSRNLQRGPLEFCLQGQRDLRYSEHQVGHVHGWRTRNSVNMPAIIPMISAST